MAISDTTKSAFASFQYLILGVVATTVVLSIISACLIGYKTGNWRPLADSTIGKLLASDDETYVLIKASTTSNDFAGLPDIVQRVSLEAIRSTVIQNIIITGFVIYLIFKGFQKVMGLTYQDNLLATGALIGIAFLTYAIIGVIYAGVVMAYDDHIDANQPEMWRRFIPFKGTFEAIKHIDFVLGIDTNLLTGVIAPDNTIVNQIANRSNV